MNIEVADLDKGYTQCSELNTLSSTKGEQLISSLEGDITTLRNNWKGNDATVHLNNLIKVHDALVAVVTDAKALTSAAGGAMSDIQRVRSANGGAGPVGGDLPNTPPKSITIPVVPETQEYYCKPAAEADYNTLTEICNNFQSFASDFKSQKDALLQNWTAGCNHETAVAKFGEFENNSADYYSIITKAKENLATAIANIKKVGE